MTNKQAGPLTRARFNLTTSLRKRLGMGHSLTELDPHLAARELIFEAPQLTPELVAAIKLISPQFRFRADENSRRFWELNQNGLCWGEYDALEPYLANLPRVDRVLDIGPGMGRSAVFFKKKLGWQDVPFVLYESSGESTKYTQAGPRFDDSFCGSIDVLQEVLKFNQIEHLEVVDAADVDHKVGNLEGTFSFVYSFFAVGFHWAIGPFLDEILSLMDERSIGAFTLHKRVTELGDVENYPHRVVEFRRSWPRQRWTRMLILAKDEAMLQV